MATRSRKPKGITSFSPIFDEVAAMVGFREAAVYGAVWRHCQMSEGLCRASQIRLAKLLGCHESTVSRHLIDLCERDYLEDLTPFRRNSPHVYRLGPSFQARMSKPPEGD